jgi:hypothetical protein
MSDFSHFVTLCPPPRQTTQRNAGYYRSLYVKNVIPTQVRKLIRTVLAVTELLKGKIWSQMQRQICVLVGMDYRIDSN